MKHTIISMFAVALLIHIIPSASGSGHMGSDWMPLFNGKDLKGWVQRSGTATYHVEDGVIVGRTSEGSPNSFLCTRYRCMWNRDRARVVLKLRINSDAG